MNGLLSEKLIEDKKQEILDYLDKYPVTSINGVNNKNQTKYIISNKYEDEYVINHGKGSKSKGSKKWKDDPRVWINIHTRYEKDELKGLLIQIKCKSFRWLGGKNNDKKKFSEKWGFPINNTNIDYSVWNGEILNFKVMDDAILTFKPSEDYFNDFLEECYNVYEANRVKLGIEHLNEPTVLIAETNVDVNKQEEIEDYLYQIEVHELSRLSKRVEIVDIRVEKPLKSDKAISEKYKRNVQKGKNAIVDADFLCEVNTNHKVFVSKVTGKNYVEAHHLIPMEFQDKFAASVDVEANIVSLCVTCHKKLHHAVFEEKEETLNMLYKKEFQDF